MTAYQTLKTVAYPIFRPKIQSITGIEYLPKDGGYILASNHIDWLDGFYIAAAVGEARGIPVHFLTKSNNYWWTQAAIQIPANKKDTVDIAVQALKSGKVLCNFAEGQRNPTPTLLPGKTGTVRMAAIAQVPVIPLGIRCSAGKNMGQSIMYLMSKHHQVDIRFGPALQYSVSESDMNEAWLRSSTAQLMSAIAPLCHKRT